MNAREQAKKPRLRSLKAHSSKKSEGVRRTIAVDFDGVIAEYDGWKGKGVLGLPRKDVIKALHELHAEGWKIVIHTTRGEQEVPLTLSTMGSRTMRSIGTPIIVLWV